MKDYFFLAFGNLKHRGVRSWLTILGVFIGIAAVVSLVTMGAGLRTAVLGQFSVLSTDTLTVTNAGNGMGAPGSDVINKLNEHDIEVISNVQGISEIIPRLLRMMKAEFNENVNFVYVASIPDNEKQAKIIYDSAKLKINEGKLLGAGDSGKVVLGENIAKDSTFGKEVDVGDKVLISGKSFEVIGILKSASSFQVNQVILMTEKDMKELLGIDDEYDMIIVKVSDSDKTEEIGEKIEKEFRDDRDEKIGEEDFSVETPLQAISSVNTILDIINLIVSGIAAVSLIIGGIGIANTMYTSVLERTKEIGVMKSIGAKNKDILYIFIIESGLLGLIGGIIGAILGLGLAFGVAAIANSAFGSEILSVTTDYPLIFGAIGFAFAIGLISGLLPAFQASKLKPVDALRK